MTFTLMNVILDIYNFSSENVYFLDKKQNIIFDGFFTKIMYSNELFLMNGVFFQFPIKIVKLSENMNKYYVSFNPHLTSNSEVLQGFADIENALLEHYKKMNNCNKKINNMLSKQIYSGGIKIFNGYRKERVGFNVGPLCLVIKISGVWETNDEIGITYKIYNC